MIAATATTSSFPNAYPGHGTPLRGGVLAARPRLAAPRSRITVRSRKASPSEAYFPVKIENNGSFSLTRAGILSIDPRIGLAFRAKSVIMPLTHSPCLSRSAVTHILGEFFYCAPPTVCKEEPQ